MHKNILQSCTLPLCGLIVLNGETHYDLFARCSVPKIVSLVHYIHLYSPKNRSIAQWNNENETKKQKNTAQLHCVSKKVTVLFFELLRTTFADFNTSRINYYSFANLTLTLLLHYHYNSECIVVAHASAENIIARPQNHWKFAVTQLTRSYQDLER